MGFYKARTSDPRAGPALQLLVKTELMNKGAVAPAKRNL